MVFYKSFLCPRCLAAKKILTGLKDEFPGLEIEELDIGLHPLRAWQDGIRFVPALKSGSRIITGFLLKEDDIRKFITEL